MPLVELRAEVSFLHSRLPLGCLALVRQQHEGDVAIGAIFALRQQTSVHRNRRLVFVSTLTYEACGVFCTINGFTDLLSAE